MLTSRWLVYGYFVGCFGNLIDARATWHARGPCFTEWRLHEIKRRVEETREQYETYRRGIEAARKIVQAMPMTERPS